MYKPVVGIDDIGKDPHEGIECPNCGRTIGDGEYCGCRDGDYC